MSRAPFVSGVMGLGLFALAFATRLSQHHEALLYPDGYQYLLMARGISENLEATTVLGPGGEPFVPSADAAVKPLFPALIAAAHTLGLSWLDAARLVTAAAGALAVVALALLVAKLTGSRLAGIGAGLLLLASPSVGFWGGFSGPDPLAQALVLLAALSFAYGVPVGGGVLTGLAIATRPEVAIVALAAAAVTLRSSRYRHSLVRAVPAAIVTASIVYLVVRAPITVQDRRLFWLTPLLILGIALVALIPRAVLRYVALASLVPIALVLWTQPGPFEVWHQDWPLLSLGAIGLVLLLRDERWRWPALMVLGAVLLLGAVYVVKNPTLSRYFSLLVPAAAALAGIAVASLPRPARPLAAGLIAVAVIVGFDRQVPGSRDFDMFPTVAARLAPTIGSAPLITAAPDAYGFWLPDHPVLAMRRGASGVVLLDATQRLYEPRLTARGMVLARVTDEIAFAGPDGEIDADPAVLVVGRVVGVGAARPDGRKLSSR